MKNVVDSRHHKTDYPLYLQKAPEQRRAPSGNPWDCLARGSQRPLPAVPAELCIRITDRAPHELSRTTLSIIDLLLNGDLLRLRSEEVADTLHISPTTAAVGCALMAPTTKASSIMCADSDAQ